MKQLKRFGAILLIISLCLICFVGCGGEYAGWKDTAVGELHFKIPEDWENFNSTDDSQVYNIGKKDDNVSITISLQDPRYTDKDDFLDAWINKNGSDIQVLEDEKIAGEPVHHFIWNAFFREDVIIDAYLLDIPSGVVRLQTLYPADLDENPVKEQFDLIVKSMKIEK